MMRPRNYGTLNRAIARSITYSLRNYGRKGKNRAVNNYNTNSNASNNSNVGIGYVFGIIFITLMIVGIFSN